MATGIKEKITARLIRLFDESIKFLGFLREFVLGDGQEDTVNDGNQNESIYQDERRTENGDAECPSQNKTGQDQHRIADDETDKDVHLFKTEETDGSGNQKSNVQQVLGGFTERQFTMKVSFKIKCQNDGENKGDEIHHG